MRASSHAGTVVFTRGNTFAPRAPTLLHFSLFTPTAAPLRQAQRAPPRRRRMWRAAAAGGAGEADAGAAPLVTAAGDGAVRAVSATRSGQFLSPVSGAVESATRSGLFRSPVSGGVESATSAHWVGRAQLCSIMPRSHHRRKGTPRDRWLTAPLTLPSGRGASIAISFAGRFVSDIYSVGVGGTGVGGRRGLHPFLRTPVRRHIPCHAPTTFPHSTSPSSPLLQTPPQRPLCSPATRKLPNLFSAHAFPPDPVFLLFLLGMHARNLQPRVPALPLDMHARNLQSDPRCTVVVQIPDPVFVLSNLGMHARNLQSDPRCTVGVQIPGWSGLANAHATIFGDLYPLPPSQQVCSVIANLRFCDCRRPALCTAALPITSPASISQPSFPPSPLIVGWELLCEAAPARGSAAAHTCALLATPLALLLLSTIALTSSPSPHLLNHWQE
ncbi:unnamed protein product [Closterium sp. Naga37s-1]|nr:unnamed protein product [Closterium sp. Naga37s-1]